MLEENKEMEAMDYEAILDKKTDELTELLDKRDMKALQKRMEELNEFDVAEFLSEMGLTESGADRLIRAAYNLLDLQTYFTAGPDECRAWTFVRGTKAPKAAGIIHTDFEKGFIRAEVIKYDDFVTLGSESAVRDAGKLGVEGKEYVVCDGDIMHFRFNV